MSQFTTDSASPATDAAQRFGRLVVVGLAGRDKKRNAILRCRCDCGGFKEVRSGHLKSGTIVSCGCVRREVNRIKAANNKTHGLTWHPLFDVHVNMLQRCYNPRNPRFADYGGRGIGVCDEWRTDKTVFFSWAFASGYGPGLSIDRIDNDGDYRPDNCRWSTAAEQQRNTRRSSR